ncbi:hypothetical protein C2S51_006247 [Perilla frutescens var. frutescens]|nr:hypothetical protein C2S51_006247 [Perilla frutescens var. frutescens]
MKIDAFCFILLLLVEFFPRTPIPTAMAADPAFTAADLILLNCGAGTSPSTFIDASNRSWDSDEPSKYMPTNAAVISSASTAFRMDSSVFPVPYQTARVFRSPFTYTFPISPGQKFLRLYFYPDVYSDHNTSQSFFSVTANAFTLFSNFSAFLYSRNVSEHGFAKEFIINIDQNQRLSLTFSPNPNSFAFVNGIEIVSIPDKLYFKGNDVPIKFVDERSQKYLENNTALENIYRLNVGGGRVEIQEDSGPTRGMFRAWSNDEGYIFGADYGYNPHLENVEIKYTPQTPAYTAPPIVYTTAKVMTNYSTSLEWGFPVDSGFYYLLRLHFCEFTQEVTKQNQRVFTISIDAQIAEVQADIIMLAGGPKIPIFLDYIKWIPDDGRRGKRDLRLSLIPTKEVNPKFQSAILNGLEIFKLSDASRSLAAANPELTVDSSSPDAPGASPRKNKSGGSSVIYAVVGSVVGVLAVVAAVSFLILRRSRKVKDSGTSVTKSSWVPLSTGSRSTTRTSASGVSLPSDLCRYFSIDEIKTATRNFDDNFVIGRGGFGNVYKGLIDNAATTVAIKRLNPSSSQGAHEFLTEIEMLSRLRHLHLVSLIGYCDEGGEMILVYDYMGHGTLRDHLYNTENSPLTWKQRLQICLGSAKGLDYLHTGAKHPIIHRDVKSTNILLDEKWVAKMSDFGLSKVGPAAGGNTHVSTVVKGSFGYLDPEYYRRQQLTNKSDVYSFGVVLFEVLCARPPIIPSLPREQVNLAEWAKFCFRKGTLEQILDSNLKGQIAPECLSKFVETAIACLKDKGIDRPSMNDVVWSLEFAMQLQVSAESVANGDGDNFVAVNASLPLLGIGAHNTTDEDVFSRSSEVAASKSSDFSTSSSDKLKSGDVFSEIMSPIGR